MIASRQRWAVLVAALAACSGPGAEDVGVDVGSDGGHDAARDAGVDASLDVGRDTWLPDGGWLTIADNPDPARCELYEAGPELVAATTWPLEPCGDRAGCRRIRSPGGPVDSQPFQTERGHGVHDGTRGLFVLYTDSDPGLSGYIDAWIVDDAARALMGIRTRAVTSGDSCTQGFYDVSETEYAFVLLRLVQPAEIANFLYRNRLDLAPAQVTDIRSPFASGTAQEVRLDGVRAAAWMSFQSVQGVEADGTFSVVSPHGESCAIADVVGDAIFIECSMPTNVFTQQPHGAPTPLFGSANNYGLDSDGTDMAWVRFAALDDGGITTEIWTAPHTANPASVHEREIATVPPGNLASPYDLRVGFGYAALLEQDDRVGVYRLADGARAQIDAPVGEFFGRGFIQYIGPEEIVLTSTLQLSRNGDSQVMFIRLDSLTFVP